MPNLCWISAWFVMCWFVSACAGFASRFAFRFGFVFCLVCVSLVGVPLGGEALRLACEPHTPESVQYMSPTQGPRGGFV